MSEEQLADKNKQLAEISIKAINGAQIPASESENVSAAKQWLMAIFNGDLVVAEGLRTPDGIGEPDLPS